MSSTRIRGQVVLRGPALFHRTHLETVEDATCIIKAKIQEISDEMDFGHRSLQSEP